MKTKQETKTGKLVAKAKWVLYGGVALNTVLLIAAVADTPKTPKWAGE